jgi:L-fuculose-phosphate aldolase
MMPSPPLPKLRADVVRVSRRLHEMGWVANHDGNVSVRLTGRRLLITPTAVSKRDVDDAMLLIVDEAGKVLEGRRKPFSELELHLAVYRARPEVECVLHAHPPHATAFGLAGVELAPVAMPELVVSLGATIPTVPRLMPKTPELVKAVETAARQVDAMLLAGNGALTAGESLEQALLRMELVEHYARVLTVARGLGAVAPLPPADMTKLLEARAKAGLGPKQNDEAPRGAT